MLLQPSPREGGCGGRLGRRQSSDRRAGRSTVALGAERRKHLYLLSFFFVFNIYKVCFLIAHLLFGMK